MTTPAGFEVSRGSMPHFACQFVDSVKCAVQFCALGAGAARNPRRRIIIELAMAQRPGIAWDESARSYLAAAVADRPDAGVFAPRAGAAGLRPHCSAGSGLRPARHDGRERAPVRASRRCDRTELLERSLLSVPCAADGTQQVARHLSFG